MYECGFGDCFRLREENQVDLYVDFGIHNFSWSGYEKTNRFSGIIEEMEEDKDFLLTHYHEDHFNGAIYMANHTDKRFNDVYISDVWNMPESVYITSLMLLRGIFTRSVIFGKNTIIDFLKAICTNGSRIHFISRNVSFHNDQYIALWPEKNFVAWKAQKIFKKLLEEMWQWQSNFEKIEEIANRLNELVVTFEKYNVGSNYSKQFVELQNDYNDVQKDFDDLYRKNYQKTFNTD